MERSFCMCLLHSETIIWRYLVMWCEKKISVHLTHTRWLFCTSLNFRICCSTETTLAQRTHASQHCDCPNREPYTILRVIYISFMKQNILQIILVYTSHSYPHSLAHSTDYISSWHTIFKFIHAVDEQCTSICIRYIDGKPVAEQGVGMSNNWNRIPEWGGLVFKQRGLQFFSPNYEQKVQWNLFMV